MVTDIRDRIIILIIVIVIMIGTYIEKNDTVLDELSDVFRNKDKSFSCVFNFDFDYL